MTYEKTIAAEESEKITDIVEHIQEEMINALKSKTSKTTEDIKTTKNIKKNEQILLEIGLDKLNLLIKKHGGILEKHSKKIIERFFQKTKIDIDDVYQDFIIKKLSKMILSYNKGRNDNFLRYMLGNLTNFCRSYIKKNKIENSRNPPLPSDDKLKDDGKLIINSDKPNKLTPLEEFVNNEYIYKCLDISLKKLIAWLDSHTRFGLKNILVYHYKKILDGIFLDYCLFGDIELRLLKEWQNKQLEIVANNLETKYKEILHTKTPYMNNIIKRIKNKNCGNELFLDNKCFCLDVDSPKSRQKLREYLKGIEEAYEKEEIVIFNAIKDELILYKLIDQQEDE